MKFIIIFLLIFALNSCVLNEQEINNKTAAQYNVRLGLAYLSQGNMPLAKQKLLQALNQSPKDANVNAALAYFFEKTRDIKLADKYYNIAIKLSKNSGEQFNNYASFLCRSRQFQKADRYFMLAVNDVHYTNTAKAYENAGFCCLQVGNKNKAYKYFRQALYRDPSLTKSLGEILEMDLQNKRKQRINKNRALINEELK